MKNIRRSIYVNIILALFILTLTAITNLAATKNLIEDTPQLTVKWVEIKCNSFSQKILEPSKDAQISIPPVHGDTVITVSISGNKGDELIVLTSLTSPIILLDPEYRRKAGFSYLTHLTHQSEKLCFYSTSEIEFTITGVSPESPSWTLLLLMTSDQGRPHYPLLSIAASEPIVATIPTNLFELTTESLGVWQNNFAFLEGEKVTVEIETAHLLAKKPNVDQMCVEIDKDMEAPYIEWTWEHGSPTHIPEYTKTFQITSDKVLRQLLVSGVTPKVEEIDQLNFVVLFLYEDKELVESYVFPIYIAPEHLISIKELAERITQLESNISELQDEKSALEKKGQDEKSALEKEGIELQNNITNLQNEVSSLKYLRNWLLPVCIVLLCVLLIWLIIYIIKKKKSPIIGR